ncbi:hypothetical protein POM88_043036 [Heracleum sosnowskyi]|uniref:Uncharacterized protein n=1 Tax=Heracleum sosnowskyi TaxID=360622 RepID=A0AAD8HHL4_9APIA|nr:hypothetical protein POM88_043036 [Heracleum sosnowskyi]
MANIRKCHDKSFILGRATNETLYKWAESDAKFIRSVSFNNRGRGTDPCTPRLTKTLSIHDRFYGASQPMGVDSMSCRQEFLRSYSFSRKESMPQKVRNCASQIKRSVSMRAPNKKVSGGAHDGIVVIRKVKKISSIFRKLLSFTTKVNVVG